MSVLGLASKRLQAVNIPEQVSLQGFLGISNITIPQPSQFTFPTLADVTDTTSYPEVAVVTGNPAWNLAIPPGKNCFIEGFVYAFYNFSAYRVGCVGIRLYKSGVPVRSVGLISGFNVTDAISLRSSTIIEADECDEVRMTCGYGGGTGAVRSGGGGTPFISGLWKLITT